MTNNLYSTFDKMLSRADKEKLLKQKATVIWLTGLSGSGKTTIAVEVEKILFSEGKLTQILDGDNVRSGLNNNLGFSEIDRTENIRRIAETAKLFKDCGIITICCFVSPEEKQRSLAKEIIGVSDFILVSVNTSLKECEKRDVKGLYAKARKGEIKDFTGVNSPFETPENANLILETENESAIDCAKKIINYLKNSKLI